MNNTICVCGAGTMGAGIAQVSATAGFPTLLYDLNPHVLGNVEKSISGNLARLTRKNKITTEAAKAALSNLHLISDIRQCQGMLIIEAIVENKEIKQQLYNKISSFNDKSTIIATNTSSLSITALAGGMEEPGRFAGMHFFNPAPLMKLVELVKGVHTSEKTLNTLSMIVRRMNKIPVICHDSPGFIVNHVARPYYLESLQLLEKGITDAGTIDALLESTGFRMGPFRLMDLIGNDVNLAVSRIVYEALGKPARLRPSDIQEQKVKNGELGRKTLKGYYDYNDLND